MTFSTLEARTRKQLVELSDACLDRASESGLEARLVVPSRAWAQSRKKQLMRSKRGGVRVLTHTELVSELWSLYGDGSRLVSGTQRSLLARPLLASVLGMSPSASLLNGFCAFVEEAVCAEVPADAHLKRHEQQLCALLGEYRSALQQHGLVEFAQAESALLGRACCVGAVIVEQPDASCAHAMRFYAGLDQGSEVSCILRGLSVQPAGKSDGADELSALAGRLYTGVGGVPVSGQVLAGEAHGAHVEGELLVQLVQKLAGQGARPEDIAIVFRSPADSYPHIQDAFARAQIPFSCSFSRPFKSTPFGSAFLNFARSLEAEGDEGYKLLSSFVASAYSGVDARDARAVQMRWRQRAGSTLEARLEDITEGFAQGNADKPTVKERLAPLARLFGSEYADVATQMFDNAKQRWGAFADQLADDAHAADALLDYLDECASVSCEPVLDDIAQLPVIHQRQCVNEEGAAVSFVAARDAGLDTYDYVVLANLDARHYPMAQAPGPFDILLSKLGLSAPDTQALRQRALLLDVLGMTDLAFGFYRVCHGGDGSEVCQSALWDELMDSYKEPQNGRCGRRVLEESGALLVISEAEAFSVREQHTLCAAVMRGHLKNAGETESLTQYPSGDAIPFSPTALEDYYRCPYRWFTSRRVGYNGMDNSFSASAQGNLAHAFFHRFYTELKKRGVRRVTPENLNEALALGNDVFDELVERGLNKPKTSLFLKGELDRLNCEVIRKQVLSLLQRDAGFLPGFEPAYLELELGRGTGSTLMYAGVPVRGKVDRVDVDENGRAVIIDYKLSSLSSGYGLRASETMPQRIQTDIYAVLVQRHFSSLGMDLRVVGSVYRSYSNDALRGVYESGLDWGRLERTNEKLDALPSASCMMGYVEYLDMVEREVGCRLENLSAGDIEPRPIAAGVCDYCKALQFCPMGGR